MNLKPKIKIFLFLLIIITLCINIILIIKSNKVKAVGNLNTSNVQLLARAINGESRGEPYEGQVSTVLKAAQDALNGWNPTDGAVYYFNPDTATNAWIWSRPLIKTIGKHRFCR